MTPPPHPPPTHQPHPVCFVLPYDFGAVFVISPSKNNRNDCPCCVADALSVTCQGGFVETAPSSSFFDKAKSFYTGGSVAMVATVSGLIVLGVITALCCCRGIHKEVRGSDSWGGPCLCPQNVLTSALSGPISIISRPSFPFFIKFLGDHPSTPTLKN